MNILWTSQFKKDYKRVQKQNKKIEKLRLVIELLLAEKTLPTKCHDHKLTGFTAEHRECHIEPDWLLIYRKNGDNLILERTGSHSDLFR